MNLVWVVIPLVLFGVIGIISPAYATSCNGLIGAFDYGESFSGNVKSIEIEWYDEPTGDIYDDDVPTIYGLQHTIFEVHQFFKGTTFETIDYQTSIPTLDPASAYNSYLEIGKEYLVIGYQQGSTVWSNWCDGGGAFEIADSIKNSETYVKPIDFIELLTAVHDNGIIEQYSDDVDYLVSIVERMSQSPKIQLENGIHPKKILCKEDFQLFFKNNYESSPVCVKVSSIQKLIERGWGNEKFIDKKPNNIIQIANSENYLKYRITDNSEITKVIQDKNSSIMIEINSVSEGNLTVELPRTLIVSGSSPCSPIDHAPDEGFVVLIDSEEMLYDEVETTSEIRTLSITFPENTREIEIAGICIP